MISFTKLLEERGFLPDGNTIKLVRHTESSPDIEELRRTGWFETYQMYQGRAVFDGCEKIVSFIGEDNSVARFVGIYDVGARQPANTIPLPDGCPYLDWAREGNYFYPLEKCNGFEDLENRVIINWTNPIAWHQWFVDREVVEIRRMGRSLLPFSDYLRVNLSYFELQELVQHPEAHPDWVAGLSAVGGIYLIVASEDGTQYVGSATGNKGIWQRWSQYAQTGHCDNARLRRLCEENPIYPQAFKFSVLETFSRSLSREDAISLESFFKEKLGTRAFGLNEN